jgi:hypothetical protein
MYHHLSRWTDADDVDDQPYQRNAIRTMQHWNKCLEITHLNA